MNALLLYRSIEQLPPHIQQEVVDYVSFLNYKYSKKKLNAMPQTILSNFIGNIPDLDVTSFETYLNETRNEWSDTF
jgi:Protein of unknown function (DUF2281)